MVIYLSTIPILSQVTIHDTDVKKRVNWYLAHHKLPLVNASVRADYCLQYLKGAWDFCENMAEPIELGLLEKTCKIDDEVCEQVFLEAKDSLAWVRRTRDHLSNQPCPFTEGPLKISFDNLTRACKKILDFDPESDEDLQWIRTCLIMNINTPAEVSFDKSNITPSRNVHKLRMSGFSHTKLGPFTVTLRFESRFGGKFEKSIGWRQVLDLPKQGIILAKPIEIPSTVGKAQLSERRELLHGYKSPKVMSGRTVKSSQLHGVSSAREREIEDIKHKDDETWMDRLDCDGDTELASSRDEATIFADDGDTLL